MNIYQKLLIFTTPLLLLGCGDTYQLHKFYRDPLSPAALLMGSTYAGVVDEYKTLEECFEAKAEAEANNREIGYTNARFECRKK